MNHIVFSLIALFVLFSAALGAGEQTFFRFAFVLAVILVIGTIRDARKAKNRSLFSRVSYLIFVGGVGAMLWQSDVNAVRDFIVASIVYSLIAVCIPLIMPERRNNQQSGSGFRRDL